MSLQVLSFLSLSLLLLVVLAPNTRQFSFQNGVATQPPPPPPPPCPLNFTSLSNLVRKPAKKPPSNDAVSKTCHHFTQLLRLVLSDYLRSTGFFRPPLHSAAACWRSFESVLLLHSPSFKKILPSCNFRTESIAQSSCMNISTRLDFERLIPQSALNEAFSKCNQSLDSISSCGSCLSTLNTIQSSYLTGREHTLASTFEDCSSISIIYTAALITPHGPADPNTAKCLFSLYGNRRKKLLIILITGLLGGLVIFVLGGYLIFSRWKQSRAKRFKKRLAGSGSGLRLDSTIRLVKFDYDEIKLATMNFHRDNLIGRGGFANVYRGVLPDDGSRSEEVAIKRFKNCTAAECTEFTNEVEMMANVGHHHVNLVKLRGYCVAELTNLVGHHQRRRIIVYDLMKNGSLHDHLFERNSKLSWPIREKIALGMARGLAYLHHGVQPAIIHRDIKASNILLDENFNAKVADFGFAKFYPQGLSHLSTEVAGTMGYLAPEYAEHGHISEGSDVYSFGVVLLELLSGKKAVLSSTLLTDWARSLVKDGRTMDVVEEGMPEPGSNQVMEKYVHVAILCSHSEIQCRPAMDQVVKILESSDDFHPQSPRVSEAGEITDS